MRAYFSLRPYGVGARNKVRHSCVIDAVVIWHACLPQSDIRRKQWQHRKQQNS